MALFFIDYIISSMKTVQQLQEEVYQQTLSSGFFKSQQAQLKSYVYDIIEKEYGSRAKGFQYQHPLLSKLRQYPLTSICLDLIQEFLESFKFKHTLNVFKKQINRSHNVPRAALAEQFRIEIKNPEAQAVLISIVSQMFSGEVGAVRQPLVNNFMQRKQPDVPIRNNYFIPEPQKPLNNTQATAKSNVPVPPLLEKPTYPNLSGNGSLNVSIPKQNSISGPSNTSSSKVEPGNSSITPIEPSVSQNNDLSVQSSELKPEKEDKKGKESKQDKKKKKVEKEKPPEGATDLLGDVMKKFESISKGNKEEEKKNIFDSKRAFSQEKEKKTLDQAESGANKIRGASTGKAMSSLMSKFMPQAQQPKNESYIDEELDEFQQSKDSTRRNPLFSSSQSGFEKSGFDHSVDSNSIDQYEYSQRARKVFKKM